MTTWPFPERPGVPLNPEVDGWHWVLNAGKWRVACWYADTQEWELCDPSRVWGSFTPEKMASLAGYLGPVRTDADVQAAVEASRLKALEDAAGVCDARREDFVGGCVNGAWEFGYDTACEAISIGIRALKDGRGVSTFDIDAVMKGYTYTISFFVDGDEYVGECSGFPSLSWLDDTPTKAAKGIRNLVREVLEDMLTTGETPPGVEEKTE